VPQRDRDRPRAEPAAIRPAGSPLASGTLSHQWWRDVSFLHWRVDAALVAPLLPAGVRPDVVDGSSWVGLVPFRMSGAGFGSRRRVPWAGDFLETNVRLYSVDDRGRRGVVFRSLEAERLLVVAGANLSLAIPYRWARMSSEPPAASPAGRRAVYTSRRRAPGRPGTHVEVEVGHPIDQPSGLEHFLTARFGAHTRAWGRTWWVPNTHEAWPLRRATAVVVDDELVAAAGLADVSGSAPDSVLFSPGVRATFGRPERL
jgi:uncharacterized protein YqjF (DUF2071 family)